MSLIEGLARLLLALQQRKGIRQNSRSGKAIIDWFGVKWCGADGLRPITHKFIHSIQPHKVRLNFISSFVGWGCAAHALLALLLVGPPCASAPNQRREQGS